MNDLAPVIALRQSSLFEGCPITAAVSALANAGVEARGAIFTRPEVVDFILDLVGYTADRPLHTMCLLEPSFGGGDFLLPAVERLLKAWRNAGGNTGHALRFLGDAVRAVELHRISFDETKQRVISALIAGDIPARAAISIADRWLTHGDFLLAEIGGPFDFVIGNPPYVRQELIPDVLLAEYRSRYQTVYDRADLYIPFIERSLMSLRSGGQLGFICADRWMKNRYGGPLRRLVAESFHLKIYVDMANTQAFHSDVIAYPAITIIARDRSG
ncbi:MAG: Eco57I restriction-modification methylase domain-containing protein, partial [Betaproteobacteria bacterium]